jgi:uncharacterized protein
MNCPICNETLLLSEKQGIEINYCPQCRGIWLDNNKLETIIERTYSTSSRNFRNYTSDDHHYDVHDDRRRKKGLFDFFD